MITYILAILLFLAVSMVVLIVVDTHRFVVRKTVIESKKVKQDTTLVVLSDLHNKSFGKDNEKLMQKIREIHPDMILLAGDMLNAKPGADFHKTALFLRRLAQEYRIYYGIGNHEHRLALYPEVYGDMHRQYWEAVKHENICVLANENVEVKERGIAIFGSMIEKRFYKRFKIQPMEKEYLGQLLGEPKPDCFTILLAHNPDYFANYADWGADLVLSGHVHGGIVRVPLLGGVLSPACKLFPKYDGGLFKEGKSIMVLSRGLGTHTIPVRLFNPGELHVLYLKKEG